MEIQQIKTKAQREFNRAVCLMSVIPFLVFIYLLVGKLAAFPLVSGEDGYILLTVSLLILLGIITGKKLIWLLITKIIDFSHQMVRMEKEIIEKSRLAAISETVLSLSHEINNPLLVMQGNLALLENDFTQNDIPLSLKERLAQTKNHCERIMEVTNKMLSIEKPSLTTVYADTKILDLRDSR
ncbi:MAG: histidine kinase dimerization/phospho-acceptor domain-containing protein [Candidatus Omnitrophica bacterium]|jgi:signal transduction histidine kinase|nr:histidine kinase dimerization/phospho-acceptor domain-containing protein [Candidatus Omnitrophota bacterium]MDD5512757.1 histidine kinase dimerization/phospho-acceptor domain-containing protein [Candidatus Omnitrophota bacterium]